MSSKTKPRTGGRSARVRSAVLEATLAQLLESGFGNLSVEAVARRAGVHKTTVYRRWPDRERLLTDALLERSGQLVRVPDTGSVELDLVTLALDVVGNITSPKGEAVLRTLVAEGGRLPELSPMARSFWAARFAPTGEVVNRAIATGELPQGTDAQLLLECVVAPLYLRLLVTDEELSPDFVARVVKVVLEGCRQGAATTHPVLQSGS